MTELLLAIAVFFLSHLLPMRPALRLPLERRLGRRGFLIAYSLLSLVIIAWLAHAWQRAPYVELWPWQLWAAWVPVLVMPLACILLVAAVTSRNPFSIGLGAEGYDPSRPGIVSVTRHPALWGLALWAGSHIPPNGDLAAVLMFGLLLLLSLGGTLTVERNRRRLTDPELWARWREGTANLPFAGEGKVDWRGIGWARVLGGLLLYAVLLLAHEPVIGIAPPLVWIFR